jgi:hypothetical protein
VVSFLLLFPTKTLYASLFSSIRATCPHSPHLISLIDVGEECISSGSHHAIFCSHLLCPPVYAQVSPPAPYSWTPSACVHP